MRIFVSILVALAIIGLLAVEGVGMYVAHRTAEEVAQGAAEEAVRVLGATRGNEAAAKQLVQGITDAARVDLVGVVHRKSSHHYEVTVRVEPKSYVLNRLPYLRDNLTQQSTGSASY